MKKRSLSLMLALLMLTSASTACSDAAVSDDTQTPSDTIAAPETTAEPESLSEYDKRQLIPDELPDVKFGGQSFRVMTAGTAAQTVGAAEPAQIVNLIKLSVGDFREINLSFHAGIIT